VSFSSKYQMIGDKKCRINGCDHPFPSKTSHAIKNMLAKTYNENKS
jgi:hypothetical protein